MNEKLYRINNFLAQAGLGSRRSVESTYILSGRVSVNGSTCKSLGTKIFPKDKVLVDNKIVSIKESYSYYFFHKPKGYIVSAKTQKLKSQKPYYTETRHISKKNRASVSPTIYFLLPKSFQSLRYAGRLDKETRGLVLLSDDGDFIYKITHPRFEVEKKYRVTLNKIPENIHKSLCVNGVYSEGDLLKAKNLKILSRDPYVLEILLQEGKNQHIRRMMRYLDIEILDLYRFAIGKANLYNLDIEEGKYKKFDKNLLYSNLS